MIEAKKQGRELAAADIHALVQAFVRGQVPDYQMAAWLMAVCWRGLSVDETSALADAYLDGSERVTFAGEGPPVVDKHSTGGVGDKLSLIVVPLAAACASPRCPAGVWGSAAARPTSWNPSPDSSPT